MSTRNHHVVLSDDEMAKLRDVAEIRYGTTEVPWGVAIDALCSDYLHDVDVTAADDTETTEAAH